MYKHYHYGYRIVVCCFLIMFVIVGMVLSTAGIFFKPVSESLGVEVGDFGIYQAINSLFSTLTLTFAGSIIKRYDARWLLTCCSACIALTYIAMSLFNNLWQFYMAGAVFGVAMAFLFYLGVATMLNRWFRRRMGVFMGICSAGSGIGGIIFNPVAGFLITEYGWRTAYLVFGLVILVAVTPFLGMFLRSFPSDIGIRPYGEDDTKEKEVVPDTDGVSYGDAVRSLLFYLLILFAFLINCVASLNIYIPAYVQSLDFSIEQASYVASAVMIGVTIGKVVLGSINDRSPMLGLNIASISGILGLILLMSGQLGLGFIIAGGFFYGWAYAEVAVQTPLLVRQVFGSKDYSRIYSKIAMSLAVGGTLASACWGIVADATSFSTIFAAGIFFLALCLLIGWWTMKAGNNGNKK